MTITTAEGPVGQWCTYPFHVQQRGDAHSISGKRIVHGLRQWIFPRCYKGIMSLGHMLETRNSWKQKAPSGITRAADLQSFKIRFITLFFANATELFAPTIFQRTSVRVKRKDSTGINSMNIINSISDPFLERLIGPRAVQNQLILNTVYSLPTHL